MKFRSVVCATVILAMVYATAAAQSGQDYVDQDGKFKLTLIDDWRPVSYSDAVGRSKTEFVYRDRGEGLLKVSKENLSASLADMVRGEEENLRIYRVGFDRAANEAFGGGTLRGMRLSFYSAEGGRKTANTYYYLQDGNSVWVLRFTGRRGVVDTTRNLTDQIARSFQPM